MKSVHIIIISALAAVFSSCEQSAPSPDNRPPGKVYADPEEKQEYALCFGNTHSHCRYSGDANQTEANTVERHFALARENGYDFYCVTDHSQYDTYSQDAWEHIAAAADEYTTEKFVAIRGYEHSENNGPGAKGHQNVYNSDSYLNALAEGIDMTYFHNWLADPSNSGVVVSMNHPEKDQYDGFACYNETARDKVTMFEVINGKELYFDSFLIALGKGWKVSPIAGCDNHATNAISTWTPRTGLAVERLTREGILDAMRNRRTYATFDPDLKLIYYVNNHVMGSAFNTSSEELRFEISVSDPDKSSADARIRRIEITGASGVTVKAGEFSEHDVEWKVAIPAAKGCYFLKIYNFTSSEPVAYAAPVWVL